MKLLMLVTFLSAALVSCDNRIEDCGSTCVLTNDCACASSQSPIDTSATPQLVAITFDESPNQLNYQTYYKKLLSNRQNPDGSQITATFFVVHEYTDYTVVNTLYNEGHEIGAHSVTKGTADYWSTASVELITQEFSDNVKIISKYANIPADDIIGVRNPHLQLAGDNSFQGFVDVGFQYDNSWTALSNNPTFPFTLEYLTNFPIQIGVKPIESYPHFWELPIINIKGFNNTECNALAGCQMSGTAEELRDWLIGEFNKVYKTKAPLTIMLSSAFLSLNNSMSAFELFLDELVSIDDVFLVSQSNVVQWAKNPVDYQNYHPEHSLKQQPCTAVGCKLPFGTQERMMYSCVSCPQAYPWLNNVDGNL